VKVEDSVMSASDHYSFFLKHVPSIHFFTGLTEQYHTPADDVETLSMPGIISTVDVAETVLDAVLHDEDGFEYVEAQTQSPGRGGDMAYFGVVPDYSGGNNGLKINGTGKDSPAEKAGLQAGDVITKFGDLAIGDIQGLADALRKYKPGDKVPVIVKRGDKNVELNVELAPPRGSKK
jgi:S1-C subfamily serine protease